MIHIVIRYNSFSAHVEHFFFNNIHKDLKLSGNLKSTILLSPAAASFDQFNNFENRGIYFKSLIIKKFKQGQNV